jgi:hypothetical protein
MLTIAIIVQTTITLKVLDRGDAQIKKIFVSYSHDNDGHRAKVQEFAERLRKYGFNLTLDLDVEDPPEGWARWMERELANSERILLVFTETYRTRYENEQPANAGRGVAWETHLIRNLLYKTVPTNTRIRVVVFSENDTQYIPLLLSSYEVYLLPKSLDALCRWIKEDDPKETTTPRSPTKVIPLSHSLNSMPTFVTRGPLQADDCSYIRRDVDSELAEVLDNRSITCCSIIGHYQLGKTSLLNRVPDIVGKKWQMIRPSIADLRSDKATLCVSNLFESFEPIIRGLRRWSDLADVFKSRPSILLLDDFGELQEDGLKAIMPNLIDLAVDSNGTFRIIATLPEGICGLLKEKGVKNPKHHKPWKEVTVSPLRHEELADFLESLPKQIREVTLTHANDIERNCWLDPQRLRCMLNRVAVSPTESWLSIIHDPKSYES